MAGPSKRDREKLRERVKTELRKQGRTQKDLEEALGVTSGTLTRVFGGRRKLDAELATGLAKELGTDVNELFRATSFLKGLELPEVDASANGAEAPTRAKATKEAEPEPAKRADHEPAKPETKGEAETKPGPKAEKEPEPKAEEDPEPQVATKSKPAPEPVRPTPPPPEEPRFRKRDIPLKAARFLLGLVFGD